MGQVFIGTSGYNYDHWSNGVFYPEGLSQKEWLEYYSDHFDTVELNVTFYRLLKKKIFENWYKRTADDFVFVTKGSRYTTHLKKLKDPRESSIKFFRRAAGLKEKLGAVLWQFPASFKLNKERLENFCEALEGIEFAKKNRHVFEFRNKEWFCKDVYDILEKHNHSLCIAHSSKWPCVKKITTDFVYLRLHGEELYSSNYSDGELQKWSKKIKHWIDKDKDVYVYFNNDAKGYAVKNALQLKEILKS